jgi:hypothetical protein
MAEPKWIKFVETYVPHRKTKTWQVMTKDNVSTLGTVKWYGAWRKYCFFPAGETVFEEQCLSDIRNFIVQKTIDHKEGK